MMRQLGKLRALRQGVPDAIDRIVFYVSLMSIRSRLAIDVLIPAADKDAEVLPYTIDGVRRNIRHPISRLFVVAPRSDRIQTICERKGCTYVNERDLVPRGPETIRLDVAGTDRSAWIYQQFLKWSGDSVVSCSHYLVGKAPGV
jgi:hypothetical protein